MTNSFDQYPREIIPDPKGEAAIFERATALDEHLKKVYGKQWTNIKDFVQPNSKGPVRSKDLWPFFLLALFALKKFRDPKLLNNNVSGDGKEIKPIFDELAFLQSPSKTFSLSLIASHPSLEEDLSNSWHPSWMGARVTPSRWVDSKEIDQLKSAMALIEMVSPHSACLVEEVCSAICLLRTEGPGMVNGSCISLTSKLVPGLIYFTPAPVIMSAESIVHEAAHLWLSRFESAGEMYVDPKRTVSSPLRPDPRPISGLMHQVWVLSNLVPFYHKLCCSKVEVVRANANKVSKRLDQHTTDLRFGLEIMINNLDALSDRGRSFVEPIIVNRK